MKKAADLALSVQLGRFFLQAPDEHHLPIKLQQLVVC
jgi:hypothetical protein